MDELRVPKRSVAVEVVLAGAPARVVALFVAEAAAGHAGPERVADVLNGPSAFIPAVDEAAGGIAFLNRAAIALVRIPVELDGADEDPLTLPTEHEIAVALRDGSEVRGVVSYVRPPDRSRLVDWLCEPAPFFRVFEPAGTVALVHRDHVARVVLLSR